MYIYCFKDLPVDFSDKVIMGISQRPKEIKIYSQTWAIKKLNLLHTSNAWTIHHLKLHDWNFTIKCKYILFSPHQVCITIFAAILGVP